MKKPIPKTLREKSTFKITEEECSTCEEIERLYNAIKCTKCGKLTTIVELETLKIDIPEGTCPHCMQKG